MQMHLVETEEALPRSLDALRACRMDDDIVAIDLEWTPDAVSGQNNPVALMSLASSSCVVLIRLCRMRGMPSQLRDFLRCPNLCISCDRIFRPRPGLLT